MDQNFDSSGQTTPPLDSSKSKDKSATFICTYEDCSKAFKAKKSLIDHTRIHKGEKPYACHFSPCEKAFTQYSSLQKHERIHKGEKPYNCETCGQSFTQVSNLKRHERSHRGERPHSCEVCSKGFTTSSNLKQHLQTHLQKDNREKYECQECGKTYNYNSSLKKHLLEHGIEVSKKEHNEGRESMNYFEMEQNNKIQIPLNLGNLSTLSEAIPMQNEKNWNHFYNFSLPSFPPNDLDYFQGFQTNFIFTELLQNTFLGRGNQNEGLNFKRPAHLEIGGMERIERYEPKNVKRLYKHSHSHNHSHNHMHSLTCEHLMIIHQGHVDYLHDGKLHHVNDNGCLEEHELELSEQNPITCKQIRQNACCSVKRNSDNLEKKKSPTLQTNQSNFTIKKNYDETPILLQKDNSNDSKESCHNCDHHQKPELMTSQKEDFCSLINHVHNELCEHPMIIHNGHIDYIVEGELHHVHDGHCDNHGSIFIVDKVSELQKACQVSGMIDTGVQGY